MSEKYTNTPGVAYTTSRYFGVQRTAKDGLHWSIQALEREYANVKTGDDDFSKDSNGFGFTVGPESLAEEFAVLGFTDLQPTGAVATVGQLFALVQSLYLHEANKRDAREAAPPPVEPPVEDPPAG
jgi:hypothetical protein